MKYSFYISRNGFSDIMRGDNLGAGSCEPIFDADSKTWVASVSGWHARSESCEGAALLVFMAWLNALPSEMENSPNVWFDDEVGA
jgi:hypothetical protein